MVYINYFFLFMRKKRNKTSFMKKFNDICQLRQNILEQKLCDSKDYQCLSIFYFED